MFEKVKNLKNSEIFSEYKKQRNNNNRQEEDYKD